LSPVFGGRDKGLTGMRLATGAWAAAVLILAVATSASEPPFEARLAEAKANLETKAGAEYELVFSKVFREHYPRRASECLKEAGATGATDFELLLRLRADGEVEETLIRPETGLSRCFAKGTKAVHFPSPPRAGFWIVVGMRFTGK